MSDLFRAIKAIGVIMALMILPGCAFMDLETHVQKLNDDFGNTKPRMDCNGRLTYYQGVPDRPHIALANLSVNLSATQIGGKAAWPPDQMIAYLAKTACEKGADALINVKVEMRNIGFTTETAPLVSGIAVRFTDTDHEQRASNSDPRKATTDEASYQDVPYKQLIQPAFAQDYLGKLVRFEAAFFNVMSTTVDLPSVFKNYVRLQLCSSGTVTSTSCDNLYVQVVIKKEESAPIFELKQGQNVRIWAKTAETRRGTLLFIIDRLELMQ